MGTLVGDDSFADAPVCERHTLDPAASGLRVGLTFESVSDCQGAVREGSVHTHGRVATSEELSATLVPAVVKSGIQVHITLNTPGALQDPMASRDFRRATAHRTDIRDVDMGYTAKPFMTARRRVARGGTRTLDELNVHCPTRTRICQHTEPGPFT